MGVASLDVLSAALGRAQIPVALNLHRGTFCRGQRVRCLQTVVRCARLLLRQSREDFCLVRICGIRDSRYVICGLFFDSERGPNTFRIGFILDII